jgi:hypothetical protein
MQDNSDRKHISGSLGDGWGKVSTAKKLKGNNIYILITIVTWLWTAKSDTQIGWILFNGD